MLTFLEVLLIIIYVLMFANVISLLQKFTKIDYFYFQKIINDEYVYSKSAF